MALSVQDEISAKRWVAEAAKRIAGKLNKQIEEGHDVFAFSIMIGVALFKDIVLDPISEFMPLYGTIFICWPVSALLMYFMYGKGYFNKWKAQVFAFILFFVFDAMWLMSLLPITTITVLWAWHVVRKRGRKAQASLEKLHEKTLEELEEIEMEAGD